MHDTVQSMDIIQRRELAGEVDNFEQQKYVALTVDRWS